MRCTRLWNILMSGRSFPCERMFMVRACPETYEIRREKKKREQYKLFMFVRSIYIILWHPGSRMCTCKLICVTNGHCIFLLDRLVLDFIYCFSQINLIKKACRVFCIKSQRILQGTCVAWAHYNKTKLITVTSTFFVHTCKVNHKRLI